MSLNFREDLLKVSEKHFEAQVEKHRINVEVLLENNVGLADHADIMGTIEKEFMIIAEYDDKLSVLKKYFMSDAVAVTKKKEVLNG